MKLTLNNIFKIIFIIGLSFVAILIFRTAKLNNDFFSQDCDIENLSLHSNNKTNETTTETSLQSILILSDNNYKVYSFTPGINYLDLNFDKIDDYIFMSHISGIDYYDYHTLSQRNIYNFFINNKEDNSNLPNYWSIVTKEIPNKRIDEFERNFSALESLGCNGGEALRLIQTKEETFLALIDENPKEKDHSNTRVRYAIYKLKKSGNLAGSDYIFSFIDEVIGKSRGCGIDGLGDKDIIYAIQKIGF